MFRDRFQFGSYGFVAGVVVGIVLGWMFSGFVGLVVRFGLVIVLFIGAAGRGWRWRC
jgi:hypothetical protein